MSIERHLKELGLTLPDPPKPAGNYVPWLVCGNLMFLSGQFPIKNGQLLYTGRVGAELTEDQGYAAARLAALNVLAQIRTALGGFGGFAKGRDKLTQKDIFQLNALTHFLLLLNIASTKHV